MKALKCFLISLLSILWQMSYAQNPLNFHSIQEVLDFETAQIAEFGSASCYINRAESYLLCQKYDLALNDLEVGYQLSQDMEEHLTLHFRSLFGLAVVYANIDQLEKFNAVVNSIEAFLDAHKCTGCSEKHPSVELCSYVKLLVSDNPEPERISVEACIEKANNAARYARILIDRSHPAARFVLNALVNRLTNKAIKCCVAGGLWKGCIQPLATKWQEWNKKWKVFNKIPTLHRSK